MSGAIDSRSTHGRPVGGGNPPVMTDVLSDATSETTAERGSGNTAEENPDVIDLSQWSLHELVEDDAEGDWDDDRDLIDPDGVLVDTWREGYPYDERMSRREYEREKRRLQIELLKLQSWAKKTISPAAGRCCT